MSANVHILSEDPRDLLWEPINLRAEILPPMYGGTNTSYDFIPRLRGWELEEEETEFSEMGSSCVTMEEWMIAVIIKRWEKTTTPLMMDEDEED